MVMASLSVSQAIFFSSTPSRFNLHSNKAPTFLLPSLQTNPSIPLFTRTNRTPHFLRCTPDSTNDSSRNWDWNRWCQHFSDIDQAKNFLSLLKFQLKDAVKKQDFQEAAKLKRSIDEATSKDTVAEIMSQFKNAIEEERYHDASRLCKYSGCGLVGWWVGYSKNSKDSIARIIRISPSVGRFVGKIYSPGELFKRSSGTPIFEIYVVKNADDTYHMKVVYLRRGKGNSTSNPSSILLRSPTKLEVENLSSVEVQEPEEKVEERNDEKNNNIEAETEDGIKSVINFLNEKLPGLKVKVMNINVEEEVRKSSDFIKQIMEEDGNKTMSDEKSDGEVDNLDEPDEITLEGDSDASEEENDLNMKLSIGVIAHNNKDNVFKDEFIRLPAKLKNRKKDSFLLHIPKRNLDNDKSEMLELMLSDVAKAFLGSSGKVSAKVSVCMCEMVKWALLQVKKKIRLSEDTYFSRIRSSKADLDPFDGLYVRTFGFLPIEIVQLRRKFGNWNDAENDNTSDIKFFEYVEAVKLTGDRYVRAGQVTFRAKIGEANCNTNCGLYPDGFGVVASYEGQWRISDSGYRNSQWENGELLQLNGKGKETTMKGVDLAFLPKERSIVLFSRLELPD